MYIVRNLDYLALTSTPRPAILMQACVELSQTSPWIYVGSTGAMENWGLITGRTGVYLLDPNNPDLQAKKTIAAVQSHEVAHMWYDPNCGQFDGGIVNLFL